jgi:hypothetical protein
MADPTGLLGWGLSELWRGEVFAQLRLRQIGAARSTRTPCPTAAPRSTRGAPFCVPSCVAAALPLHRLDAPPPPSRPRVDATAAPSAATAALRSIAPCASSQPSQRSVLATCRSAPPGRHTVGSSHRARTCAGASSDISHESCLGPSSSSSPTSRRSRRCCWSGAGRRRAVASRTAIAPQGCSACSRVIFAGFIILLAFTSYDQSRSGGESEALTVIQQFETAEFLPEAVRRRLRSAWTYRTGLGTFARIGPR